MEPMHKVAYPSCQGQFGVSSGSKDARNPNAQKAENPNANIAMMTRANTDRLNKTRAASRTTESTPRIMSNVKFMNPSFHKKNIIQCSKSAY
ncbi:MAG TPA: hypothetical protein DCX06_08115 [Opitutae bacterium]|nr:hypothetical protein [Opitutae bacterium]